MKAATNELLRRISQKNPDITLQQVFDLILGIPQNLAPISVIEKLFEQDYYPGTFIISERKTLPDFLPEKDRLPYEDWVKSIVEEHLEQIKSIPNLSSDIRKQINVVSKEQIAEWTLDVLEDTHPFGLKLSEMIWNQEFDDIFRRIEAGFIVGNPEFDFDVYASLKCAGKKISFWILNELKKLCLPITNLITISALSGLMGLNYKTYASAASPINSENIIPISLSPTEDECKSILTLLLNRSHQSPTIDDRSLFINFISSQNSYKSIAFILDDYIESLFDLSLAENILKANPNVSISIIPRWGLCGNDMSYQECVKLLNLPFYWYSSELYNCYPPRLHIIANGPRLGGFNGRKISTTVAQALINSDILYVKGARNYEMMQGIKKNTYYSFTVCREISEIVTGIPASSGAPVFIYQPSGKKTFQGFWHKNKREKGTSSRYCLNQITAKEFVKSRKTGDKNGNQ
jgi:hypothetical protein